jgi:hypothetical protein
MTTGLMPSGESSNAQPLQHGGKFLKRGKVLTSRDNIQVFSFVRTGFSRKKDAL